MKRFFILLITVVVAMGAVPALAEPESIDLTAMSLDDLRALQLRVLDAMWASDGWQEVEVPVGAYKVGVEIPAGKWTLTAREGEYASIKVVSKLNATGTEEAGNAQIYAYQVIASETSFMHDDYPSESFTLTLAEGMYLIIEDAPVIFTPPAGPSFSFK